VGQVLNQPCIHGLDEPDFGGRQRTEGLGSHEEYERSVRGVLLNHLVRPEQHGLRNCQADLLGSS
jgi:hypothetical protein